MPRPTDRHRPTRLERGLAALFERRTVQTRTGLIEVEGYPARLGDLTIVGRAKLTLNEVAKQAGDVGAGALPPAPALPDAAERSGPVALNTCPWCGRQWHPTIRRCTCGHDPRCQRHHCRCETCFSTGQRSWIRRGHR